MTTWLGGYSPGPQWSGPGDPVIKSRQDGGHEAFSLGLKLEYHGYFLWRSGKGTHITCWSEAKPNAFQWRVALAKAGILEKLKTFADASESEAEAEAAQGAKLPPLRGGAPGNFIPFLFLSASHP